MLLTALAAAGGLSAAPLPGAEWPTFPALVWRLDHPYGAIPPELVAAFGGVNVEGPAEAPWAREQGLDFYVGHAPGRNELHIDREASWYAELWQRYWDDRDPSVLVRQPCLGEPETLELLEKKLGRTLAARDGDHGLGISLGDEVGLTAWSGPLDLCASEACRRGFARFLGENEQWAWLLEGIEEVPFPSTDATRHAWVQGDPGHVGAWLARRDFHHGVLIDLLEKLAAKSRELSPGTAVGLFGLGGRSTFGGVGPDDVLPFVDFLESYPILDSRELLHTMRAPGVHTFATVFSEPDAPHGASWQIWEHWLRGGDGVVLWSDRELANDRVYFENARRAVAEVRRLSGELPEWSPTPGGVALIHHPDSTALSWLRDALHDGATWPKRYASYQNANGTREVRLRASLRWLEDAGALPGSLPFAEIGARTVERFPFLVACELILVEERELAALKAYVAAGGHLLVNGGFGTYNRRGEASSLEALERLRSTAPERVIALELDPARYLEERTRPESRYADDRIGALQKLLGPGVIAPWKPRAREHDPRWLIARVPSGEPGEWLCAAIPNRGSSAQREELRQLEVGIEGLPPGQVSWIHPKLEAGEAVQLRAGDALVFRIEG